MGSTCHRVRVKTKQATTKTAVFVSKCIVAACKCVIVAHMSVAFATVAIMSVSQHAATSEWCPWFRPADIDFTTIKYLKRHSVFPWVVIILVSLVFTVADVVVIGTLLYLKKTLLCKQKKTRLKYTETEKTEDKPPRASELTKRPHKGGHKHRRYPAIQSFKLHDT